MTSSDKLKEYLSQFEKALASFNTVLQEKETEFIRDSAIKRFEFTYEIAWKVIKRISHYRGVEVNSPRQAFRQAFKEGWIKDDILWSDMIDARNLTVHVYKEEVAENIYEQLPKFYIILEGLFQNLTLELRVA